MKGTNYIWTSIEWLDAALFVIIGLACIGISFGIPLLLAYWSELLPN